MATVIKFLVKGLKAVNTHSTEYMNLDHPFLSAIDVSRDVSTVLILFLNCKSSKPSGSSLSSLKSKEPQEPLRILMTSLRWLAASLYLIRTDLLSQYSLLLVT